MKKIHRRRRRRRRRVVGCIYMEKTGCCKESWSCPTMREKAAGVPLMEVPFSICCQDRERIRGPLTPLTTLIISPSRMLVFSILVFISFS